jgi:hypothetical protein
MEPPLSERPLLGGKGYQRDGAVSRFSRDDFYFISFYWIFIFIDC